MANRSYIYGLKENNKPKSIGEYPYFIPYAYRILAAYENKVVESQLYDKTVGIIADFNKGKKALYYLLDYLIESQAMESHNLFVEQVALTKIFLDKIDAHQTLLENGEIYALYTNKTGEYLDGPGLERVNTFACEDYKWIGEDIDFIVEMKIKPHQFFNYKDESFLERYKWIFDLRSNWEKELGLDSWRDILYYQFT